jgi:hypothetical protein
MQSNQADQTDETQQESGQSLTADEILILRDTDETAAAVAHLAAARLYALMTSDAEEPGVNFKWFDHAGVFAAEGKGVMEVVTAQVTGMASYVRSRQVQSAEQIFRHTGGKDWASQPVAYRQALEVFRLTALSVATGMEARRNALIEVERQKIAAGHVKPLAIEDSIFEPETSLGEMLPHAVQADKDAAKARQKAEQKAQVQAPTEMSVGEPPAGHHKAKTQPKRQSSKKSK